MSSLRTTSSDARVSTNLSNSDLVSKPLLRMDSTRYAKREMNVNGFQTVTENIFSFEGGYMTATVIGIPTSAATRTVEVMAKFSSLPSSNNGGIACWGSYGGNADYCLVPRGGEIGGNIGGHFYGTNLNSGESISTYGLNTWMHICMTYDGIGGSRIYINGVYKGIYSGSLSTGTDYNLNIARRQGSGEITTGIFRELRIWNKCLSLDEIQDTVNTRFLYTPSGLIYYSRLNEPLVASAVDLINSTAHASSGAITVLTDTYPVYYRYSSSLLS